MRLRSVGIAAAGDGKVLAARDSLERPALLQLLLERRQPAHVTELAAAVVDEGSLAELAIRGPALADFSVALGARPREEARRALSEPDRYGLSVLDWAVAAGNREAVHAIVDFLAPLDGAMASRALALALDTQRETVLQLAEHVASRAPHIDLKALRARRLTDALLEKDNDDVERLLATPEAAGALLTNIGPDESSALERALGTRHFCAVWRLLLESGGIDDVDAQGRTVLHRLADNRAPPPPEVLLAVAALDPVRLKTMLSAVDAEGYTPFGRACVGVETELARLFLAVDPSVADVRQGLGFTPLMIAVQAADEGFLFALTEAAPALLHAVDPHGCTALHHAARGSNVTAIRWLLACGIDADVVAKTGRRARDVHGEGSREAEVIDAGPLVAERKLALNAREHRALVRSRGATVSGAAAAAGASGEDRVIQCMKMYT